MCRVTSHNGTHTHTNIYEGFIFYFLFFLGLFTLKHTSNVVLCWSRIVIWWQQTVNTFWFQTKLLFCHGVGTLPWFSDTKTSCVYLHTNIPFFSPNVTVTFPWHRSQAYIAVIGQALATFHGHGSSALNKSQYLRFYIVNGRYTAIVDASKTLFVLWAVQSEVNFKYSD